MFKDDDNEGNNTEVDLNKMVLKKEYALMFKRDSGNSWSIIDSFDDIEDARDYLKSSSKHDGYIDGFFKFEVIYRWE